MDRRVEAARQLMEKNLKQSPTLSELASSVNLSASRLSHLFKTETGVSLGQYLRHARMESARHLLETSFLSVKQIMVCVGISDISHFARCFKDTYGVTPTEYRNHAAFPYLPESGAKSPHRVTGNQLRRNEILMS
jgi:AraC family transcriptional regulator, arabinose operon regulatory protein